MIFTEQQTQTKRFWEDCFKRWGDRNYLNSGYTKEYMAIRYNRNMHKDKKIIIQERNKFKICYTLEEKVELQRKAKLADVRLRERRQLAFHFDDFIEANY